MVTRANSALPPLPCACSCVRRAARVVTQMYDEALRPAGLRVTQFALLEVLARIGPLTQGQIGKTLGIDSTTLSRTLGLLRRRGLVGSAPGRDRRERHWRLTAAGRARREQATGHWSSAVQQRLRRRVGDGTWRTLHAALDEIAGAAVDR